MFSPKKTVLLGLFTLAVSSALTSAAQRGGAGGQDPAGQAAAQRGGRGGAGGQGGGGGRGGAQRGGGQQEAVPVGVTIAGEVPNYVPVTDAMLRNPAPGDWL